MLLPVLLKVENLISIQFLIKRDTLELQLSQADIIFTTSSLLPSLSSMTISLIMLRLTVKSGKKRLVNILSPEGIMICLSLLEKCRRIIQFSRTKVHHWSWLDNLEGSLVEDLDKNISGLDKKKVEGDISELD